MNDHELYMRRAIALAENVPELPFGAVIADGNNGKVLTEGWNKTSLNPMWHGEVDAINRLVSCGSRWSGRGSKLRKSHGEGFRWQRHCWSLIYRTTTSPVVSSRYGTLTPCLRTSSEQSAGLRPAAFPSFISSTSPNRSWLRSSMKGRREQEFTPVHAAGHGCSTHPWRHGPWRLLFPT